MRLRLPGPTAPLWVAVGAGGAGAATYLLLVVVGRGLGEAAFGTFSMFWTVAVVVSLGVFLAVEQVTARRTVQAPDPAAAAREAGALRRRSFVVAGVLAGAGTLWVWYAPAFAGGRAATTCAVLLAVLGFVPQFVARGQLAARGDLRGYAAVLCTDALGRLVAAGLLVAVGVETAAPYAVAVGASAAGAGAVGAALVRRGEGAPRTEPDGRAPGLGATRDLARLVTAMLGMQLVLNSPVVVATALGHVGLAGRLLAVYTLARLPVFVAQAAQAAYVARAAAAAHRGDQAGVARIVRVVLGGAAAVALLDVVLCAAVVPAALPAVFGAGHAVDLTTAALAGAGVGLYLVASVANDLSAALGGSRHGVVWTFAVAAGVLTAVLAPGPTAATVLPLVVGSAVAAVFLVQSCVVRAAGRADSRGAA